MVLLSVLHISVAQDLSYVRDKTHPLNKMKSRPQVKRPDNKLRHRSSTEALSLPNNVITGVQAWGAFPKVLNLRGGGGIHHVISKLAISTLLLSVVSFIFALESDIDVDSISPIYEPEL